MATGRVVDAVETTDKKFIHWKMRFKAAAGAFEEGRFKEARTLMFRTLYEADSLDQKAFAIAASTLGIAVISLSEDKLDESKSHFEKGLRAAAVLPDSAGRQLHAAGLRFFATWFERKGDLAESEARLRESVRLLQAVEGGSIQLAYSMADLAAILVRRGEVEEAHKLIVPAVRTLATTVGIESPQYDFAKMVFEVCSNRNDEENLLCMFEMSASKIQYKMGDKYPSLVRALHAYAEGLTKRGLKEHLEEIKGNYSALMRASTKS